MRRRAGGGDGSTASRSTGDANRATVADRSTSLTFRTDDALDVTPRAGIPVEQPCPADVLSHLQDPSADPEFPQPV
jgi:hypothetical protein